MAGNTKNGSRGRGHRKLVFAVVAVVGAGLASGAPIGAAEPAETRDGLWRMIFARPVPDRPAVNPARAALGHDLFRDTRLSGDGTRACATCHDPAKGFSNAQARGIGRDGQPLARNVPSPLNAAWGQSFYWDGRAPTLEAQARFPILAPNEMGGDFSAIVARLSADEVMRSRFAAAFPDRGISEGTILTALADYERTLVSARSRFDRWVEGEDAALSKEEKRGFDIFVGRGGCVACHGGWRFTDDGFHDIGLKSDDPGRGAVAGGTVGSHQFKTPSLRELARTAPYMHDGSLTDLNAVVDHYAGGLEKRPTLAANIRRDLRLDATEKQALVAFLKTLSSDVEGEPHPSR